MNIREEKAREIREKIMSIRCPKCFVETGRFCVALSGLPRIVFVSILNA